MRMFSFISAIFARLRRSPSPAPTASAACPLCGCERTNVFCTRCGFRLPPHLLTMASNPSTTDEVLAVIARLRKQTEDEIDRAWAVPVNGSPYPYPYPAGPPLRCISVVARMKNPSQADVTYEFAAKSDFT